MRLYSIHVCILICSLFSTSIAFAQIPSNVPQAGLVAWYNLDNSPVCEVTPTLNGVFSGTVAGMQDRFGNNHKTVDFTGTGKMDVTGINITSGPRSYSFWFRHNSSQQNILLNWSGGLELRTTSSGQLQIQQATPNINATLPNFPQNQWNHIAVTFGSGILKVFLNGSNIYSLPQTLNNWNDFSMGYGGLPCIGMFDELGIWAFELNQSQIDALYQRGGCLKAEYKFSGNVNDGGGFSQHGTATDITYVNDRFGVPQSAVQFNGSSSFITGPTWYWPAGYNQRSIELWFNVSDTIYNGYHRLFHYGGTGTGSSQEILPTTNALGVMNTLTYSGGNDNVIVGFNGVYNQWHHVVATYDGSVAKLYINGQYINQEPKSWPTQMTTNFIFGAIVDFTHFYKGKLDDVRVYGCVLNNSQVDSLYNLPAGGSPCQITASASTVSPSCFQGSNGSIDLSLSGGTSPYTYMWSNGSTTQDLSTITAGNYTVVIHDATGCDAMLTVNVPHPTSMSLNVSTTSPTCGMDNGSASVVVSNGVMPYTYNWSNGDNISVADSMTAGTYMITAYDANGCSAAHTFMLSSSGAPTVTSVVTNATCAGSNNGAIDLTVTGGTPPFSFVWSNSSTTEDLAGIKPGSYMVQITDAAGCITGAGIIVGVSSIQVGTPVISQPACGASDGSIAMNPTGASPFTYLWSANAASATTPSVSGLPAGIYSVTISDNNNCSVTQNISLSNPNAPVTQLVSVMPANCSGMLGAINMNVTSGTPPFTYSWSNGATTQDISNLLQGTYHLSVTGGNGCMSHSSATVPGIFPDPITLCMSTVDSASGKVLCVWEKPNLFNIDRFNIYRENAVAGQYDFWFTKPFDSLSQWTDQSANPVIRGWRYKVTMVDTCGNESSFGTNHKTLHLVSSRGLSGEVNLIWDTYEGFNYPTVYINRYHASTGWELIDSVPSTLHAYVDVTAPASGLLRYTVDVRPPTSCEATRAINHNSTRSNRGTIAPPAAVDELLQSSFRVFPNPTDGVVSIVGSDPSAFIQDVMIYDLSGKRIHRMNIRSSATSISIENLERGIYILEVHTPTGIARYRIVRS